MRTWAAEAYHRSFERLCAGAVPDLLGAVGAPAGGRRLLDAGSGTGVVAAAAAQLGWRVDAVDLDAGMTAYTARHLPTVTSRVESIAALSDGDHAFDAVTAGFSLNHADHPSLVVGELHRVLRSGAPIAATVWPWQRTEMNALWSELMDETSTRPARVALPAGEPFERTEPGLAGLLAGGGFHGVATRRLAWTFEIAPGELWRGIETGLATIGQAYLAADDGGRRRLRAAYDDRTAELAPDGLLRFPVEAILGVGIA